MRLKRAHVEHFRSIVDSGDPVELEDEVTVLIGKNEQGKTNFLRALASLNQDFTYSASDLPNHLRPGLEEKDLASLLIISLWLTPDPAEIETLAKLSSSSKVVATDFVRIDRFFGGHYKYSIVDQDGATHQLTFASPDLTEQIKDLESEGRALGVSLESHANRLPQFAGSLEQARQHITAFTTANLSDLAQLKNLRDTLASSLASVPNQDKPIQDEIASRVKAIDRTITQMRQRSTENPERAFWQFVPRFIRHSTLLDRIPNDVTVSSFVKDPDGTSKGMANLCRAAGLSLQKIAELAASTDVSQRESYEDHYRSSISGGINEFWTQAKYNIHFRIEREKLSVSISDSIYAPRIAPTERSDGFQWYLSFYSTLLSETTGSDPTVILLDNPGLELHPDGQRDIKRFLQQQLPASAQVIYVTHSPAMIDPYRLEQVRKVELLDQHGGTKVSRLNLTTEAPQDLLEPVRSAIGASLVSSLIVNDLNVLVEGAADKPILEGAFAKCVPDEAARIVINGSVSESGAFLPRFYQRSRLPFVVFLDADSRGRELRKMLSGKGIPDARIIDATRLFGGLPDDFELEDILSSSFYHSAVCSAYPGTELEPVSTDGKRTKLYEKQFRERLKIGFCKTRVADRVKHLLLSGDADTETMDHLQKVAGRILEALKAQASEES